MRQLMYLCISCIHCNSLYQTCNFFTQNKQRFLVMDCTFVHDFIHALRKGFLSNHNGKQYLMLNPYKLTNLTVFRNCIIEINSLKHKNAMELMHGSCTVVALFFLSLFSVDLLTEYLSARHYTSTGIIEAIRKREQDTTFCLSDSVISRSLSTTYIEILIKSRSKCTRMCELVMSVNKAFGQTCIQIQGIAHIFLKKRKWKWSFNTIERIKSCTPQNGSFYANILQSADNGLLTDSSHLTQFVIKMYLLCKNANL